MDGGLREAARERYTGGQRARGEAVKGKEHSTPEELKV